MDWQSTVARPFDTVPNCVARTANQQQTRVAVIEGERALDYRDLDRLASRVAASLQREMLRPRDAVAVCAAASIEYLAVFLGALRAGMTVVPLAPSARPYDLDAMLQDAGARILFVDDAVATALSALGRGPAVPMVALDGSTQLAGFAAWLSPEGARPAAVQVDPAWPFNIIYSSGTTGEPKGIVQSHQMRWGHVQRAAPNYGDQAVTLIATPLYSNTTLASVLPTLALGGTIVLMPKFDAAQYLQLAQRHRVTHTMLVPVQYQRIMARPDFGHFDLSAFRMKYCTSAPFSAALKRDVLDRWPGGLVELYGMTEGGGTCVLLAHEFPHKLHTVGRPAPGNDMRVIDESGVELPVGEAGEVVGHSATMMDGYYNDPARTAEVEWRDATGKRFIRTGDIGRFDEDGFLTLIDRKKDVIISGGFNLYPKDIEAVLREHPEVGEVAVVGVPSQRWGETPIAFVAGRQNGRPSPDVVLEWANERLGKTQRIARVAVLDELPRSGIGKVLKRDLRERFIATHSSLD